MEHVGLGRPVQLLDDVVRAPDRRVVASRSLMMTSRSSSCFDSRWLYRLGARMFITAAMSFIDVP
jgi:type IV secretory pathway protease TraF